MQGVIHAVHTAIVGLIKLMPLSLGVLVFRVYNKALKMIGPEFRAPTYFKARLFCDPHDLLQRMILHFGVWEPDVSRVIERNLEPGDIFVDVGANIGYDTVLASRLVGASGGVIAIEASPRAFSLLTRNVELNGLTNVRAVKAAVSDRVGKLDLYEIYELNIGAATTLASRGGKLMESVDALPLEDILTAAEMARVRLLKIDIEGAEPPVLQHLLDRLSLYSAKMDIIVEASPEDDYEAWKNVFGRLTEAGFSAWEIDNSYELEWYLKWRKPKPLRRSDGAPGRQQDLLLTRLAARASAPT